MKRIEKDNYPTPYFLAKAGWELLKKIALRAEYSDFFYKKRKEIVIFEPGCGDNQPFISAVREEMCIRTSFPCYPFVDEHNIENIKYYGEDIRDVDPSNSFFDITCRDFLKDNDCNFSADIIMMNPPFSLAAKFVSKAMSIISESGFVLMLGRQSFLMKTKERREFWEKYPPVHVAVISPRPSFTGDSGTDGCEYCFYIWNKKFLEKEFNVRSSIGWIDWQKPSYKSPNNKERGME